MVTVASKRQSPQSGPFVVDIGVFAHQEEERIGAILADLGAQDVFDDPELDVRVRILANGCTDGTVPRAHAAIAVLPERVRGRVTVDDIAAAGKSRTHERFVHELSRPSAAVFVFVDADIRLVSPDTVGRLVRILLRRPGLHVFVSRPVKDVIHSGAPVSGVARLIAAGAGGLADWRTTICGQLYAMRAGPARRIHLPVGLPVEDGFIRAMMLTDLLTRPEKLDRIDGDPEVFHVYESIRTLPGLIRHQTRLVVGSAINRVLFDLLRRDAPTESAAYELLQIAAGDETWLWRTLKAELPRRPYGYVPFSYLTGRLARIRWDDVRRPRRLAVMGAGVALDAACWIGATLRMVRGRGAGYW